MTYSVGNLIEATDYNGFVGTGNGTNINSMWNNNTVAAKGYGQTALPTVAAQGTVSATQWASLVNTISAIAAHQGTAITSRTAPTAGTQIAVLNAVSTDITNCYANVGNAAALSIAYTGWTGTNSKTTSTSGAAWTITFTNTVTWASADAAKYFFLAGGLIKIDFSKTATGQTGDPEWNDLANNLASRLYISAGQSSGTFTQTIVGQTYTGFTRFGGTGTPALYRSNEGFYNQVVGDSPTNVYVQYADTAPYTNNYISVFLSRPNTTSLVITTYWVSSDGDPISGGTAAFASIPGTAPCTICTYFAPSTTYLTNSWGTPTITATVS
jgi:hypothetical protein